MKLIATLITVLALTGIGAAGSAGAATDPPLQPVLRGLHNTTVVFPKQRRAKVNRAIRRVMVPLG